MNKRIVVFAYSDVGFIGLSTLIKHSANIVAVYTHLDNANENIWFRSVSVLARQYHLPVFYDVKLSEPEEQKQLAKLAPDIIFSFYYRNMIPTAILDLAKDGAFNLHGSLLPKYRGRAPVNWAVLHGETETGATLHYMIAKPDAGDIVAQEKVLIGPDETAAEVSEKINMAAEILLENQIPHILQGNIKSYPQDQNQASYFGRRTPEDGKIDWHQSAQQIHNLVRAVTHPFPGAFTFYKDDKIYIWKTKTHTELKANTQPGTILKMNPLLIATGAGIIEVLEIENPRNCLIINEKLK